DRIAIIVRGKIAAIGTPGELIKTYGGERTIVFTKGGDAVFGTLRRFFDNVAAKNGDVLLPYTQTRDVEVALNALTQRGLKVEIALRSPTIEDVFLKLAGVRITAEGDAKCADPPRASKRYRAIGSVAGDDRFHASCSP